MMEHLYSVENAIPTGIMHHFPGVHSLYLEKGKKRLKNGKKIAAYGSVSQPFPSVIDEIKAKML